MSSRTRYYSARILGVVAASLSLSAFFFDLKALAIVAALAGGTGLIWAWARYRYLASKPIPSLSHIRAGLIVAELGIFPCVLAIFLMNKAHAVLGSTLIFSGAAWLMMFEEKTPAEYARDRQRIAAGEKRGLTWKTHLKGAVLTSVVGVVVMCCGISDGHRQIGAVGLLGVTIALHGFLWFLACHTIKARAENDAAYIALTSLPVIYTLDSLGVVEPAPWTNVGAFRITSVHPQKLELRGRVSWAFPLVIGGVLLVGIAGLLCSLIAIQMIHGKGGSAHDGAFAAVLGLFGVVALWTGLSRLGLIYTFDSQDRCARRQRMFGHEKVWPAREINHVLLTVESNGPNERAGREWLVVTLVGNHGKELNFDPIFGYLSTRSLSAASSARAAIFAAHLLGVPVRVKGVVKNGTEELVQLLHAGVVQKARPATALT